MIKKAKLVEWLKRYGPAEIAGTIGVYVAFFVVESVLGISVASGFAAACGENVGFYSIVFFQRFKVEGKQKSKRVIFTELITEFGPSEILDTFLMRPFFIISGAQLFGPELGVLAGKVAGDIAFYIPVIATYELREWWRRSKRTSETTPIS